LPHFRGENNTGGCRACLYQGRCQSWHMRSTQMSTVT
jgi:hypothetical protein